MEMQDITKEEERKRENEGAYEGIPEGKTEEEAEPAVYSKLTSVTEDIYAEAFHADTVKARPGKQTEGNLRLYRAVSVILGIVCLILLLVVIILTVKLQAGPTTCPDVEVQTCNEKCHTQFPDIQPPVARLSLGCRQCADGWLTFGSSCFYLSTYRLNWEDSQKNCTARGGSLAVIKTLALQRFLIKKGRAIYWIGLRNKNNKWTWVDNTLFKESFWAESESEGDCGILKITNPPEKNWIKAPCSSISYFMCELQFSPSPSF
ncbi:hypothetical protein LDENG_00089190 [Lucifuga dentata]|nr:hypothetical protein LDENG_00089190 [Lucifuga dentata]